MYRITCIVLAFSISFAAKAQFLEKKEDLKNYEGCFNFYYNEKKDEIYPEVDTLNTEFLYTHFLASRVGPNDISLDRGQLGGDCIVKFQKAGNKLLLIQPDMNFRAITDNEAVKQSVAEAFAKSVLFAFEIKAENGGKYIIDFTPFLMQDVHGVANKLKEGDYGSYKLMPTIRELENWLLKCIEILRDSGKSRKNLNWEINIPKIPDGSPIGSF